MVPEQAPSPQRSKDTGSSTNSKDPEAEDDDFRAFLAYVGPLYSAIGLVVMVYLVVVLLQYDALPATAAMAKLAVSDPRLLAVIAVALGTLLAKAMMGGLNQMFRMIAQHRILQFRSIYEIEVWTYLSSGRISMAQELSLSRMGVSIATVVVAGLHAFCISIFVSFYLPVSLSVTREITDTLQLDLSASSSNCLRWVDDQIATVINPLCNFGYVGLNLTHQDCKIVTELFGALEGAEASMLAHIRDSIPHSSQQEYTSDLSRLGNTRILGSTAGVIPMGPSGVSSQKITTKEPNYPSSGPIEMARPERITNHTLILQGIWVDVFCLYDDQPGLHTVWMSGTANNQLSVIPGNGSMSDNSWTFYLRTCGQNCGGDPDLSSGGLAYAGIGSMTCTLRPQLRDIKQSFDLGIEAFIMTPLETKYVSWNQPTEVFNTISSLTRQVFAHSSTRKGNLLLSLIDTLAATRYGLPKDARDVRYPALIGSMIKGVFEYEATLLRLRMTTTGIRAPEECLLPVIGNATRPLMGQDSTAIPLEGVLVIGAVFLVSFSACGYFTWLNKRSGRGYTPFDPTSIISLVAAAAAGGFQLGPEAIGEPDNKVVRNTKVKYAKLSTWDGERERWGFVTPDKVEGEGENVGLL